MDRDSPLGNSEDVDLRRALHVKVKNKSSEPILVSIVNPPPSVSATAINAYAEALSVASSVLTTVVTFTVPVATVFTLGRVEASGDNIAKFWVYSDATIIAQRRTYFGGDLNTNFEFESSQGPAPSFPAGTVMSLKTEHNRPMAGDFDGRIQGFLTPI